MTNLQPNSTIADRVLRHVQAFFPICGEAYIDHKGLGHAVKALNQVSTKLITILYHCIPPHSQRNLDYNELTE